MPGQGAFEVVGELPRQPGRDLNVREPRLRQLRLAEVASLLVKNPLARTVPGFDVGHEFAELLARSLVGAADSFHLIVRDLGLLQGGGEVGEFGGCRLGGEAGPVVLSCERDCLESALDELHPLEFTDEIRDGRDQHGCIPPIQQAVGKIRAAGEQAARALKDDQTKEQEGARGEDSRPRVAKDWRTRATGE